MKDFIFTSESVSEGHPDKICDLISDNILDAFLSQDKQARCAVESLVTTNQIILAGEVRSQNPLNKKDIENIARETVKKIGYCQKDFHWKDAKCDVYIHPQSEEIAKGVDATNGKKQGAGDQGIMFGYACDETKELMPAPILYAHQILEQLANARKAGKIPLLPDSKSQVGLLYQDGKPVRADHIIIASQHQKGLSPKDIKHIVCPYVQKIFAQNGLDLPKDFIQNKNNFRVNTAGSFVNGGPNADAGLTGRKIIVDTYGGRAPHGGGAFSGKDPSKVDRSAAYMMRYLAKHIVAAQLAKTCTIQISYAIGEDQPLSLFIDLGDSKKDLARKLETLFMEKKEDKKIIDLSPAGIRTHLRLDRPIYAKTACYGHFGRKPCKDEDDFTWEVIDDNLIDKIKAHLK